jgi:AraC-like DNA-binding protein
MRNHSQKTDHIGTFLTSPEGDPARGIREPAPYVFRTVSAWAAGGLGQPPRVRFLESTPPPKGHRINLFLVLLGRNHLARGPDRLVLEPGDLGVVLGGEGHRERWEAADGGRYLQLFIGLPPGRLSMNIAGEGVTPGHPASPRILAGASLAHSESSLLEQMILYLRRRPESSARLVPAIVDVLRTGVSLHRLRGESPLVRRAIQRLIENPCHPEVGVRWVAERLGCHPDTLSRRFHAETGRTFLSAVREVRMQIAADLLAGGNLSVGEVAGLCGYRDHSYFTRVFRDTHGTAPSRYHGRPR